jgi:hypothetical protein
MLMPMNPAIMGDKVNSIWLNILGAAIFAASAGLFSWFL